MKCLSLNNWRTVFLQLHIFPGKNKSRHCIQTPLFISSLVGWVGPLGQRLQSQGYTGTQSCQAGEQLQ